MQSVDKHKYLESQSNTFVEGLDYSERWGPEKRRGAVALGSDSGYSDQASQSPPQVLK